MSFGTYRDGDDRRRDRRTKNIIKEIRNIGPVGPNPQDYELWMRQIKALEIANLIAIANCPTFSEAQRKDAAAIVAEQTFGG